jgi:glycogen debranching enzyme
MATAADSLICIRPRSLNVYISRGRTVFATDHQGWSSPSDPDEGLYVYQTRVLSRYCWRLDGKAPQLSAASPIEQHRWMGYYVHVPKNCKQTPSGQCDPLQQTIELRLTREVGEGLHEDVDVTNHTQLPVTARLELTVEPEFASRKEEQDGHRQHGRLQRQWLARSKQWELLYDYRAVHRYHQQGNRGVARMQRSIRLRIENASSAPTQHGNRIRFDLKLRPKQTWHACLSCLATVDGNRLPLNTTCAHTRSGEYQRQATDLLAKQAIVHTAPAEDDRRLQSLVDRVLRRSQLDLAALRMYDIAPRNDHKDDRKNGGVALAAGVPTYVGVFGRDMLASAWQGSLLTTDFLRGALETIGQTQATEVNDWRDAQPGRFAHEAHTDPLAVLNYTPKALYYGGVSPAFLYSIALGEFWHWTADRATVRRYLPHAVRALRWADDYILDSDGFYKYETHSEQGLKNQGWKDSGDAIVHADGSQAQAPIGTCEMQAFAYAAKLYLAEVLWWLDEKDDAMRLLKQARKLKQRFNQRFWMNDQGFIAMGIDRGRGLIRSIASDPGHCLLAGVVEEDHVKTAGDRLLSDELFSGWGVRTLSSAHPAFNPFSYHRGSVWPVENAAFILAFARYGLHAHMHRLALAFFESATLFPHARLPELFGGHTRDRNHPFPGLYYRADWPQAWSAGAPFIIIQALIGLYPYAPMHALLVDPHLPSWLPEVRIQGLRVGKAMASVRFWRKSDGTSDYQLTDVKGPLHVLRQPSPSSITAGWGERIRDLISSTIRAVA